jgi:hypothetical protein
MFDNILIGAALALFAAVTLAASSSLLDGSPAPASMPTQAMPVVLLPLVEVTAKRQAPESAAMLAAME